MVDPFSSPLKCGIVKGVVTQAMMYVNLELIPDLLCNRIIHLIDLANETIFARIQIDQKSIVIRSNHVCYEK